MVVILCAALAAVVLFPTRDESTELELRALYEQAAQAISRDEPDAAIPPLQQLIHQHAASPWAPLAAFHLIECYLLDAQPAAAWDAIEQWTPRILGSEHARRLEPELISHFSELIRRAACALPETAENAARIRNVLERLADQSRVSDGELDGVDPRDRWLQPLWRELAARYERLTWYAQAVECLERAGRALEDGSRDNRERFRLRLAMAHQSLQQGEVRATAETLQALLQEPLTEPERQAARFALAEVLSAQRELEQALQLYQELSTEVGDPGQPSESRPAWHASVVLRRAELLLARRDYQTAQRILGDFNQHFPQHAQAHEVEFLLARCAIANVDFEAARQHLASARDAVTAQGTEAVPRASWMIGETYFLQRRYADALAAYQAVVGLHAYPDWQARGLLQAAKAYELLGQPLEALVTYQRLVNSASGDDAALKTLQLEARQRLQLLQPDPAAASPDPAAGGPRRPVAAVSDRPLSLSPTTR